MISCYLLHLFFSECWVTQWQKTYFPNLPLLVAFLFNHADIFFNSLSYWPHRFLQPPHQKVTYANLLLETMEDILRIMYNPRCLLCAPKSSCTHPVHTLFTCFWCSDRHQITFRPSSDNIYILENISWRKIRQRLPGIHTN